MRRKKAFSADAAQPSTSNPGFSLNGNLERHLAAYATAASAALGFLALGSSARAEVVFTPTNETVVWNKTKLDLNNDGIPDFGFVAGGVGHVTDYWVFPFKSNQVWGRYSATALPPGVAIGPHGKLAKHFGFLAQGFENSSSTSFRGPWANATDRFLGLAFQVNGETHYGWVRMSADARFQVTISGYAFESTPNTPLVTGITHGARLNQGPQLRLQNRQEQQAAVQQPTLGLLASGADAIAIWRREQEA